MKALLLTISLAISTISACASAESLRCSDNWTITGYYTPLEVDFNKHKIRYLHVEGEGNLPFPTDFVSAVKLEGWGKTSEGWYLGYYDNRWHRSAYPLDARGNFLTVGTVATDIRYIEHGKRVSIPSLQTHMKRENFTARDVGSAIKRRHVDVYTGEGPAAKQVAYDITANKQTVCFESSKSSVKDRRLVRY